MKNLFFLIAVAVTIGAYKSSAAKQSGLLTGKLVAKELCNHYIVALESGTIEPSRMAATWKDEKRNATYTNAFGISSSCSFAASGLEEGDLFSFELVAEGTPAEVCATCMAFYPTPEQKIAIKNIKKINP